MAATLEQLAQGLAVLDSTDAVWRRHNACARNAAGQIIALSRSDDQILESVLLDDEAAALEYLYLSGNPKLRELRCTAPLPRLLQINLSNCALGPSVQLPAGCEALRQVYFRNNQLEELRFSDNYPALQLIDAGKNQLRRFALPQGAPVLQHLYLKGNDSLESPPAEIAAQGSEALLAWYAANKKALREIKVLLVGDAKVGKTSVLRQLKDGKYQPDEVQTDGILIEPMDFGQLDTFREQSALHGIKGYFWDFGGQEIMSSTHQFFMTKRSVYLLILEARKDADPDRQVRDWLQRIQAFGGHSPVIVVVNKIELNRSFGLDMYKLQRDFPQLKAWLPISCATEENIAQLRNLLAEYIPQAELCNSMIDEKWIAVKDVLQTETKQQRYIEQRRFREICEAHQLSDSDRQREAITFLNDLGVLLHFDQLDLSNFFVLDPYWVTSGVYRIITSETAALENGELRMTQLDYAVNREPRKAGQYLSEEQAELRYEGPELRYLADILVQFKLGYYTRDHKSLLIPDLLPRQTPAAESDALLASPEQLRLVYRYDYLPTSVLPRFMVEMQADIRTPWRSGVILQAEGNVQALLRAEEQQISILTVGPHKRKREYLSVIRSALDKINGDFNIRVEKRIPLPGHEKRSVSYEALLKMENAGKTHHTDWELDEDFLIADLLEGMKMNELSEREALESTHRGAEKPQQPPLEYGIEEELEGVQETIRLMIRKKSELQKEAVLAYDAEKKFALNEQIQKMESDLELYREKASELRRKLG